MRVLDVASGTGDLAIEAACRMVPLGEVVACDLSGRMLDYASKKFTGIPAAYWHIRQVQSKAEDLPLGDGTFDAATIGFALRNVSDLDQTFRELHRVLKPGGRIGLLEFGRPASPLLGVGHWLWLTVGLPVVGFLTTGRLWPFTYLRRSILQFMEPVQVCRRLQEAGFAHVEARPMSGNIVVLYTGVKA